MPPPPPPLARNWFRELYRGPDPLRNEPAIGQEARRRWDSPTSATADRYLPSSLFAVTFDTDLLADKVPLARPVKLFHVRRITVLTGSGLVSKSLR